MIKAGKKADSKEDQVTGVSNGSSPVDIFRCADDKALLNTRISMGIVLDMENYFQGRGAGEGAV